MHRALLGQQWGEPHYYIYQITCDGPRGPGPTRGLVAGGRCDDDDGGGGGGAGCCDTAAAGRIAAGDRQPHPACSPSDDGAGAATGRICPAPRKSLTVPLALLFGFLP